MQNKYFSQSNQSVLWKFPYETLFLKFSVFILALITSVAIFAISSFITYSYAQSGDFQNDTSSLTNQTLVGKNNWTTYKNDVLGISFDYPSGWDVKEKTNRFDSGADVSVFSGNAKFFIIILDRPKDNDNPLRSSDLRENTQILEGAATQNENTILVEGTDVTTSKIGGEKAGSFVTKVDDGISPHGVQTFVIIHQGDAHNLNFLDSTQTFDSPKTQSIMNRIIQSFKFL